MRFVFEIFDGFWRVGDADDGDGVQLWSGPNEFDDTFFGCILVFDARVIGIYHVH